MAKRGADKELTKDNWDDEEDEEQAGHFKVASDENLIKRKIIKAKRRVPAGSEKATGNVFQGFTGFAGLNSNKTPSPSSFLSSKPLPGINPLTSSGALTFTTFKSSVGASNSPLMGMPATFSSGTSSNLNGNSATDTNGSDAHLENVKALNISVNSWIKKHVDLNPYVDLTPIFRDYEKHMKSIDEKFLGAEDKKEAPMLAVTSLQGVALGEGTSMTTGAAPSFSFGRTEGGTDTDKEPDKVQPAKESSSAKDDEQTEDSVPKPEKVVSAEEGAFHSIRCKLFFKRDDSWSELGVGMLNLKKLEEKTQLLIRNDTTLGKVVLNVFLSANMPINRSGKNNVMLVCVPNPPLYSKESEGDNSKPAMFLIRVKTAENADELFEQLNSNKPVAA